MEVRLKELSAQLKITKALSQAKKEAIEATNVTLGVAEEEAREAQESVMALTATIHEHLENSLNEENAFPENDPQLDDYKLKLAEMIELEEVRCSCRANELSCANPLPLTA